MSDSDTELVRTALAIAKALGATQPEPVNTERRYSVVRGDRSGVFAGFVTNIDGTQVTIEQARRLWYWKGAASVTELAEKGVSCPADCKFTGPAGRVRVLDAIEVTDCTSEARLSIEAVPVWTAHK